MEIACRRAIVARSPDRQVMPLVEPRAAVRLAVPELCERELVAAARGLDVSHTQGDVIEDVQHGKIVSVILENGVVRTMEPSLPLARALAIAGELVAGGVSARTRPRCPGPERIDLGGRCVVPGFTDSHVHFPTWAMAQHEVRLEGTQSLEEAVARVRDALGSADRHVAARPRLAQRRLVAAGRADEGRPRRDRARPAGGADGPRLALGLAQLGRAGPRERRPAGARRRGRARRARRADGRPARGVVLALPRPLHRDDRRRVRRGDARRASGSRPRAG